MSMIGHEEFAKPTRDEVMEELWRIKDELSAEYGHDMRARFEDICTRQRESGNRVVNFEQEAKAKRNAS